MGIFTPWRIIAWAYASIVNDMIFAYHIVMFLTWLFFNVLNVMAWVVMYSLYLELTGISKLEDMAKLKMDTLSSRAGSIYGSRPTSPHSRGGGQGGTLQSTASSYGYAVPPQQHQPRRQAQFWDGSFTPVLPSSVRWCLNLTTNWTSFWRLLKSESVLIIFISDLQWSEVICTCEYHSNNVQTNVIWTFRPKYCNNSVHSFHNLVLVQNKIKCYILILVCSDVLHSSVYTL